MKPVFMSKMYRWFTALTVTAAGIGAQPWSFGVMSDTQWKSDLDGENPGTVAVGIIRQINRQFIDRNVKFVIQVGDLVDSYSDKNGRFSYRAAACSELYDAGIGFFPVRGNHESSAAAAVELPKAFPQTLASGPYHFGTTDFTSPMSTLEGLSYSFSFGNATFILLDQFTRPTGSASGLADQLDWLNTVLSNRNTENHAFIFAHKNLCGGNHGDGLFGNTPASEPALQNDFYRICASNGVRYVLGGHDHMHTRSLMSSPDGTWSLEQLICSSNSYKFYVPLIPGNDARNNSPARETPISQELFTVGYYIFTVDGPNVTVDYYTSPNGCGGDCDLAYTPVLTFSKHETWGYSLNGKKFIVPRGYSFTAVHDEIPSSNGFSGTGAALLGGINGTTGSFHDGRSDVNEITTGWTKRTDLPAKTVSDALTLWGMQDSVDGFTCEPYTLSLSYDAATRGPCALMVKNSDGSWSNAVTKNSSGTAKFIVGPWKSDYPLGTYGIDPQTKTTWAVIDHASDFAVQTSTDGDQNGDGIIDMTDIAIVNSFRNEPAEVAPLADLDGDGKITILDVRKLTLLRN